MFLHSWHPQAILFHAGHLTIHWYGLTLAIGALAGFFVVRWIAQKYQIGDTIIVDLFLVVLITGLVGARMYHVSNEWGYYRAHLSDIIKIWNGGLAWHGGLIGGTLGLLAFSRWRKIPFWTLTDILAPGLAVGQAIGRWGNYFNQELFGRPTGLPWGIPIDTAHRPFQFIHSLYFHPTFLYESLGSLLISAFMIWLHRRRWSNHPILATGQPGTIAMIYLILAAGLRIAIESLRVDHTPLVNGVRLPIITGLVIVSVAVIVWLTRIHAQRPDYVA